MADVLGIQKSIDAYKSILETMQAFGSVIDSLTRATPATPSGTVCMDGLCMDKTEVTESAYAAVKGSSPSSKGPNMPVTLVTYNDAKDFCEKKGKRLPTGAEWEKFAGSNEYATHDGKLVNDKNEKEANFDSRGPMNVGSFLPNSHGMYDMTGNVWEWVSDGNVFRDLRGGSWFNLSTDLLRVGFRIDSLDPDNSNGYVGFRCVAPEDSKK